MKPKLIIHGGAGNQFRDPERGPRVRAALREICGELHELLEKGTSARDVVIRGCRLLEDNINFNAGTGSVLQSDGQIRMSAGLMDGSRRSFSGVLNVSRVKNPIELAAHLQAQSDRVLSESGAAELSRELEVPIYDPATEKRLSEWLAERRRGFTSDPADLVAEGREDDRGTGTIGVVALDKDGNIAVGTSTGGRGFERIGRVSDSAMPAGNYASPEAAVSCTGVGEDIIDECLAARIVIRVVDGMSLREAMQKSIDESAENERRLGAIALSKNGDIVWGKTTDLLLGCWHDGDSIGDCVDAQPGVAVTKI